MNSTIGKTAFGLLIAFFILYLGYFFYMSISPKYKTQTVTSVKMSDSMQVSGIFVRDEKVLTAEKSPLLSYTVSNAHKVSNGNEIAVVYNNASDLQSQILLNEINKNIAMLESSQDTAALSNLNPEILLKQINERFGALLDMANSGNVSELAEIRNQFLIGVNRKQITTNQSPGFAETLAALKSEAAALKAKISSVPRKITTNYAGYFVSIADGFEEKLSFASLDNLSYTDVDEVLADKNNTVKNNVGKIISNYKWYYIFKADKTLADRFQAGNSVSLSFSFEKSGEISALVEKVKAFSQDQYLICLSSDVVSEYFTSLRSHPCQVIFSRYSGLRIHRQAVRATNNVYGVYVKLGGQLVFKKIDQLYQDGEYIISKEHPGDSAYVQLFDEVVIEGKNAYGGKPVE